MVIGILTGGRGFEFHNPSDNFTVEPGRVDKTDYGHQPKVVGSSYKGKRGAQLTLTEKQPEKT